MDIKEQFTGQSNAGKPILLEGGLQWQEMNLTPKDMDFIESKNSAARDIALAFGVPPQLLTIKGDNSYNNMQEATIATRNTEKLLTGFLTCRFRAVFVSRRTIHPPSART